jgi:signal transduction histidine kinase
LVSLVAACGEHDVKLGEHRQPDRAIQPWILALCALVAAALVASVVLPGRESSRVLALLADEARLLEPARLLLAQVEFGTGEQGAELRGFSATGDTAALRRAASAGVQVARGVVGLDTLGRALGGPIARDAAALAAPLEQWMRLTRDLEMHKQRPSDADVERLRLIRGSIDVATTTLRADLARLAAEHRVAVVTHEHRGLLVNALLVLLALGAITAVFEATRRDLRRARREASMRATSEALAAAFTMHDVTEQIALAAAELFRGGAPSRWDVDRRAERAPVTIVVSGEDEGGLVWLLDRTGVRQIIADALDRGQPVIGSVDSDVGRALAVPLGGAAPTAGVLLVTEFASRRFRQDDLSWAAILGKLSFLALEKVRLLEEARDGRSRLERVMESRSRLMRGFSHDVKNPLGAADGFASLLGDGIYGAISEEQRRSIDHVRQGIHRALTLIDDLHELARAETGKLSVNVAPTDVAALARAIAEEYEAAADAKALYFEVDVQMPLPLAATDPSRVRQIVANLISNAVKYTKRGGVTLRVRGDCAAGEAEVTRILIEVIDTGPGVPPDKISFIFEEFARIDRHETSGAGLGLAISKRVADALGCELDVDSEVGRGSTFRLCIPIRASLRSMSGEIEPAADVSQGTSGGLSLRPTSPISSASGNGPRND